MSTKGLDEFCASGDIGSSSIGKLQAVASTISDLDLTMRNTTATYMCTTTCPCPIPSSSNNNWINLWSDDLLTSNNRSKTITSG